LKLRKLSIYAARRQTLHSTVANIVQHSPDLVSLTVRGTTARKELTTKLGDGIKCLSLSMHSNTVPPISCKGLRYLKLVSDIYKFEPSESPCGLSYLTHLKLDGFTGEGVLSIMEAYNIGENLELLHLDVTPQSEILSRTPKLKVLRLADLSKSIPLHVCPALRTIQYDWGYVNLTRSERNEVRRQLESQGYIVTRVDGSFNIVNRSVCLVCRESHE
jgi:hypothetical protein